MGVPSVGRNPEVLPGRGSGSVQPPTKTAIRRNSACSSGASGSWLQAIVLRSVCWRTGARELRRLGSAAYAFGLSHNDYFAGARSSMRRCQQGRGRLARWEQSTSGVGHAVWESGANSRLFVADGRPHR